MIERVRTDANEAEPRPRTLVASTSPAASGGVSGSYELSGPAAGPFARSQLRLDVDGLFPLMVSSGSEIAGLAQRVDWVARPLTSTTGPGGVEWFGPITYTHGDTFLFQFNAVRVERNGQLMRLTLTGGGPDLVREYKFTSAAFREVEFEFDAVEGVTPFTSIRTHDHADRPGTLADEELTIEMVYRRAGFDVRGSGGASIVPLALAADDSWSDAEMHDAMQTHWSRFANRPQWSLWTLFAGLHEEGVGLGGIMFDEIGPNHRQGTALFLNSFIATAPDWDPSPEAWVRRMAFWTACHEMGHAFNLAHAWDKDASIGSRGPWMPMEGGFGLLSFMNYPFLYQSGGFEDANTVRFFRAFDFRFTDEELLFLRHAPEHFVEMGGATWFDNHGFEQADVSPVPRLRLEVRVNRGRPEFEYLEPVVIELKLTNTTADPCLVPDKLLRAGEMLTVVVKRENYPARVWHPYAHYCWRSRPAVLGPGESLYESLFVAVGSHGWLIAEPGRYQIQVCLRMNGVDVVSAPFSIRVVPPRGYDEEYLAQDFYSDGVGRALAFDGTRADTLKGANATLREVVEKLPDRRAAVHARVAISLPQVRPFKQYDPTPGTAKRGAAETRGRFAVLGDQDEAREELAAALTGGAPAAEKAAEALGHIDFRYYTEQLCEAQEEGGDAAKARNTRQVLFDTLTERKVLPRVLAEIHGGLGADGGRPAVGAAKKKRK